MSSHDTVRLSLQGLEELSPRLRSEVIVNIRHELEPFVTAAGKTLKITTGAARGDLNLVFDSASPPGRICHGTVLGEDGSETVFVKAHSELRVCGPPSPVTGRRDTRRFLTADWLLGRALANTAIHELGHFIADFKDTFDTSNYMMTFGLDVEKRTISTQREVYGRKKHFTEEQKRALITQLKKGEWLGDFTVQ